MRVLLLLILLSLTAKLNAQNPSVSASEEQDRPQSLLLSLTGLDVSQVKSTQLFTVEDGYAVNSLGQLIQASKNVTTEFISGDPVDARMDLARLALKKSLENKTYVIVLALQSGK